MGRTSRRHVQGRRLTLRPITGLMGASWPPRRAPDPHFVWTPIGSCFRWRVRPAVVRERPRARNPDRQIDGLPEADPREDRVHRWICLHPRGRCIRGSKRCRWGCVIRTITRQSVLCQHGLGIGKPIGNSHSREWPSTIERVVGVRLW